MRRLLTKKKAATARTRTAAPPMAIPAIAPLVSLSSSCVAGDADVAEDEGAVEAVAVAVAVAVTVVGLLSDIPFAVRLLYAAQSLTGTASGHVGFWHRLSSCGPIAGLNVTGGAHRTLY